MRSYIFGCLLAALTVTPSLASEELLLVDGKLTSKVTARVVRPNNLIITDDKGGWFGQGLTMEQFGGWETPYESKARLRVVSTSGKFRVRVDQPLQIVNQANSKLVFRDTKVSMGAEGAELKPLVVDQAVDFVNPEPSNPNVDSEGYYNLAVSALPPPGDFRSTVGTYKGTLSLTFEPVITKQ